MSYRDLFIVLIRIFAVYQLFFTVLNCIEFVNNYFFDSSVSVYMNEGAWIGIFVSLAFLLFLIYKTTWLVDFFKLDKGFDTPGLDLKNINTGNVIVIIIFFVGASLLIKGVIHLGSMLLVFLKYGPTHLSLNNFLEVLTMVIGILLIYKKNWIVNLFVKEKV